MRADAHRLGSPSTAHTPQIHSFLIEVIKIPKDEQIHVHFYAHIEARALTSALQKWHKAHKEKTVLTKDPNFLTLSSIPGAQNTPLLILLTLVQSDQQS